MTRDDGSTAGQRKQPNFVSRMLLKVLGPAEVDPEHMKDADSQRTAPAPSLPVLPAGPGPAELDAPRPPDPVAPR